LNNCKDKEQNVTNFNDKIEVINSELISKINLMASTTELNSGIKFDIHFLADGTIQNKELIFNELDNCYTILLNERSIIEDTNYSKLLSESYQTLPTINLSTFYNQRASVKNKINTVLTSLLSDQEKVIELYSDIT
jgi:hypothetical protein